MLSRRPPASKPEGFYASAEKDADRAIRTEARGPPRRRRPPPLAQTDWSHAKIKIGPRHQASLSDQRCSPPWKPPAGELGGVAVEDVAALDKARPWAPAAAEAFERAVSAHGDDLAKIHGALGGDMRRIIARYFVTVGDPDPDTDDEDVIYYDQEETRLVAEFMNELRLGLGTEAHAEALATLRRYDQGMISAKQVAEAMDKILTRDDLRAAFRYFLPAELGVP